jgi:hypothetical protein
VTRIQWRAGAVLVGALLLSVATTAGFAGTASAASTSPRIVKPGTNQVVKKGEAKVVVKLAPGTSSFRAWLGDKRITDTFSTGGLRRVAHLPHSRLKRGVNSIYVKTDGASGRVYDSTSFIVARRDPRLLRLSLRVGKRAAPAIARATHTHGSELRATLNGSRVRDAFLHRQDGTRVALLGASDDLRFGKNRLVVKAVRRSGSYDVVKRRFRIPRDRPLASAGGDRQLVVGTTTELNPAATRLPGGAPAGAPRYRWWIVEAPGGEVSGTAAAGASSSGALSGKRTATPAFTPRLAGMYTIRVRVRPPGGGAASRDTVLAAVRPNDPPIGARLETAGTNGVITIDGKPVPGTGTDASTISYDLLDRATRQAPTLCRSSVPFAGTVPRTVAGIRTLEGLVGDCSDPRYMLILSSASGIGDDKALAGELSNLLTKIGGSALGDEPTQAQFSVIGIPTAPEGSAFTSFGETSGTRQGRLLGYLQFESAVDEYGFQFADYPAFATKAANVPEGEVGVKVGDQLITDHVPAGDAGCNPAPDRETPCAGFQVVSVDRYDLHVRSHNAFEVNTGYGADEDKAEQDRMRTALSQVGANDLVFIQSFGRPRATTPAWDGVAREIQKLGGTRSVFDRLDGSGGYALVGSVCQPPGALGCDTGYGGSAAALEASSLPGGNALVGGVVDREPRVARLEGLLARNRGDQFDPAQTDPTTEGTNQLLPVLYGTGEAFPQFTGGAQNANAWITRRLLGSDVTPADMRQQYYLHYDDALTWSNRRTTLGNLTYAEAASSCGCSEAEFNAVKTQLDTETERLVFVERWIEKMQAVLDPTSKTYFDLKKITDDVQAAVRPPDKKGPFDPSETFEVFLELGSIVLPEEGPIVSVIYHAAGLFTADDTGSDGAPLLDAIDERSSQVLNRIFVNYEYARGGLVDMGKIIVSDYGKLKTVAAKVNGGPWAFPSADTPLRTAVNKGFKTWMYTDLMSLVWQAWDLPQIGNANARTLECNDQELPIYDRPFRNSPDTAQYEKVIGINAGRFPRPEIREQTTAFGRPDADFVPYKDATPPGGAITDPLFGPASLDPGNPNLALFPASFFEQNFEQQTFSPSSRYECRRK